MTLAPIENPKGLARWAQLLAPARQLAEIVASTDFVPAAMRNNPDACCAAIMYGDEIGIEPMQALASIHVVDGRPQPSAELVRAMILAAGHTITVHEATDQLCRVSGLRRGAPESERTKPVQWTLDDARRAGLLRRQNWQNYPRAMLLARATGDLARMHFPDVIKGLGHIAEDEPEAIEAWAGSVEVTSAGDEKPAAKRTVRRKPRAIKGAPIENVPLPEQAPDGEPEPGHPQWTDAQLEPWAQFPPVTGPEKAPGVAPHASPQAPPDEPAPSGVTDSLRKSLMAAASRLGIDPTADRQMRLALWSALMGRKLESGNDLTRAEALTLLRRMNDCETGAVEWDYSVETGAVTLRRIESEPPDNG